MSHPRYDWWGYCKGMIKRYPLLAAEREALRDPNLIADYSGQPRGGSPGNPTAQGACRTLPGVKEREYQAVADAIRITMKERDGRDRLKLIELMFWARSHTLHGAATAIGVSYRTANRWHSEFIRAVAKNFGLLD